MARRIALLLSIGLMLTACQRADPWKAKTSAQEVVDHLTYARDTRTGLCYAVARFDSSPNYYVASVANVPCDSMWKAIGKNIPVDIEGQEEVK